MSTDRIGFVGLGDIGTPMAMRIADAGHALSVYNRSPDRTRPFAERGVAVAASLAELTETCDMLLLCVSDTAAVEQIVFGEGGIASRGRAEQLLVDSSTIHPVRTQEMALRLAKERGMGWVDAPVSGGSTGARAGTLAVMAGGTADHVARAKQVLESFGKVTHMGPVGCGMATKACNQMLAYGTGSLVAETLNFAARFGVDPARIPEALASGFGGSNVLRHYGPMMVDGSYEGNTLQAKKDLDILMDLASLTGSAMPMTSLVASFFRLLVAQGYTTGGLPSPLRMYAQGPLTARRPAS